MKVFNITVNNNVNFVDIGNYVTTELIEVTVPVYKIDLNEEEINKFISNDNVKFTVSLVLSSGDISFQLDCTKVVSVESIMQFSAVATVSGNGEIGKTPAIVLLEGQVLTVISFA